MCHRLIRKLGRLRLAVLALSLTATGCGDNFPKLCQAEMSLLNECADHLMKVVDESTARHFLDNYADKLKNTWEDVEKRKELYMKNSDLVDQSGFVGVLDTVVAPGYRERGDGIELVHLEALWDKAAQTVRKDDTDSVNKLTRWKKFLPEYSVEWRPRFVAEARALRERFARQKARLDMLVRRLNRDCPKLIEASEGPRKIFSDGKVGFTTPILQGL